MFDSFTLATMWLPLMGAVAAAAVVQAAATHWRRTLTRQEGVLPQCGLAGHAVARRLLTACGLERVQVKCTAANDRYDSIRQEIELSSQHHDGASVAALAIASHEVGHAQQYAVGFWACRVKKIVWAVCLLLAGGCAAMAIVSVATLPMTLGAAVGVAGVVSLGLQLAIVLSMELDASRRARRLVEEAGLLAPGEETGFDGVLRAAALTYAAAEARRWMFLIVAIVVMICLGGQLSFDEQAANLPEEIEAPPLDLFSFLLEDASRVVLLAGFCLLLWRLQPRKGRNDAERAIERSNTGLVLYERGEFQASLAEFDAALQLDPHLAAALFNRSAARLTLGQLDTALEDLDATLRLNPGFVPAVARRGDVWLARGDLDRAATEYNRALEHDPANALALVGRGNVWLRRGDAEAALRDFEQAIRSSPDDPLGYVGRATVHYTRQDCRSALDDFNCAMTLGYHDAATHILCGQLCLALEDYDRAIAHLSAAIDSEPQQPAAWRDRGLARLRQERFEQALADLDEAIRLDPTDAVSFNNRGVVRMKTGDKVQARADLEAAIKLDPELPNPRKHLATIQ